MRISGHTKVCGVIGDPICHTLSPAMHNAAFKEAKLDYTYVGFRVTENELQDAMRGVRSLGIHGINVTMPHKSSVIKYLDGLDPTAQHIGATNTILNEKGKLKGFNTDGIGAMAALERKGVNLKGKKLLLLGAGGAARAVAFQAAPEAQELTILNRTVGKARELARILDREFGKSINVGSLSLDRVKNELENTDVIVNATSVGMHPRCEEIPISFEWLTKNLCIMDFVYDPLETRLIKAAKAKGAKVINGLEVLVAQGAASFEIWTGVKAPLEVMSAALAKRVKKVEP
jgi:shikimate dehydrogenase